MRYYETAEGKAIKQLRKNWVQEVLIIPNDYYTEAEGVTMTHDRAIKEIKRHWVTDTELSEFYNDLGKKEYYQAKDILAWLGY